MILKNNKNLKFKSYYIKAETYHFLFILKDFLKNFTKKGYYQYLFILFSLLNFINSNELLKILHDHQKLQILN